MVYNRLINSLPKLPEPHCALCEQKFTPHSAALFDSGLFHSSLFCPDCSQDLPKISPACHQCGISIPATCGDDSGSRCGPCLTEPPAYDRVISAFAYAEPIKQLVAQFKYQRQLAVGAMFAHILKLHIQSSSKQIDAILPVPLHSSRLRQRGFNQALELARPLAKLLKLPLLLSEISRRKNTLEQSSLHAKQRRSNLHKAFAVDQAIPYKSIAIVDDVMTTGSTVEALSVLLKQNGVEYVEVWCVARASIRDGI